MHRFFVPGPNFSATTVEFTPAQARQLHRVLRLQPGDTVQALDNSGEACVVRLDQVGAGQARGTILERAQAPGESHTRVVLYQGLLKGDRWEWVLQKGTEVGISGFAGVTCARSVARLDGQSWGGKVHRWSAIVQEAAEQSGRGIQPDVLSLCTWEQACREVSGTGLLLYEGERRTGMREALRLLDPGDRVCLLAGPEGGLTEGEVDLARAHGIPVVTLGPRILRAETAGVIAAALVLYERGEME